MFGLRKFRQDSVYTINAEEKNIYDKLNLQILKPEIKTLSKRREHFTEKLNDFHEEFNDWRDKKDLL